MCKNNANNERYVGDNLSAVKCYFICCITPCYNFGAVLKIQKIQTPLERKIID